MEMPFYTTSNVSIVAIRGITERIRSKSPVRVTKAKNGSLKMDEMSDIKQQLRDGLLVAEQAIEGQELWLYIKSVTQRLIKLSNQEEMPEEERIELIKEEIEDIRKLLKEDLEAHGFDTGTTDKE